MSKELLDTQVSRGMKSHSTILSPLISPPRPWPLKEGGSEELPPTGPQREVKGARGLIRKPGTKQEGPLMSTGRQHGGRSPGPLTGGWDARQEA